MKFTWKICVLCCFLTLLLFTNVISGDIEIPAKSTIEDTLVVAVRSNQHDLFLYRSEAAGFHLELIRAYSYTKGQPYRIRLEPDENKRWQLLFNGEVDMLISTQDDSSLQAQLNHRQVLYSMPLENNTNSVWVVNKDDQQFISETNAWIDYYRTTPEYEYKWQTYFIARNPSAVKAQTTLSPYDQLIKHYAKNINWDWRLLAALIYQESKFRPNVESYRGAYGLMQITPTTANHFKFENIEDPQKNIAAGTSVLRSLQKEINNDTATVYDNTCFILAAYNAGIGRLKQCKKFAATQGKNPFSWQEVATVIPLMKHRIYYENDDDINRFKGAETLNYVEEVMDRFELYKLLLPS